MTSFESFLYGLVQGLTEYLPVSSSAHLVLLPQFLGEKDPGLAFDVFLHIGTLLATTMYFFKDWMEILKHPIPRPHTKIASLSWVHIIIGTLPAVVVGGLLKHWIEDHTRSNLIQAAALASFGLLLWWVDRQQKSSRSIHEASYKDLFVVGCMQSLALIPGVSRSGSTITAARMMGFSRQDSMRMSFLLSMPITFGAIVFEMRHWQELIASVNGITPLLVGGFSALIFGALAIQFMMKWMKKVSFGVFAIYRIILAIVILTWL